MSSTESSELHSESLSADRKQAEAATTHSTRLSSCSLKRDELNSFNNHRLVGFLLYLLQEYFDFFFLFQNIFRHKSTCSKAMIPLLTCCSRDSLSFTTMLR